MTNADIDQEIAICMGARWILIDQGYRSLATPLEMDKFKFACGFLRFANMTEPPVQIHPIHRYSSDLNAIREAAMTLFGTPRYKLWSKALIDIVIRDANESTLQVLDEASADERNCSDLNPIHEIEETLTQTELSIYRLDLEAICQRDDKARLGYTPTAQSYWRASAIQRCEALLRCWDLWLPKDDRI